MGRYSGNIGSYSCCPPYRSILFSLKHQFSSFEPKTAMESSILMGETLRKQLWHPLTFRSSYPTPNANNPSTIPTVSRLTLITFPIIRPARGGRKEIRNAQYPTGSQAVRLPTLSARPHSLPANGQPPQMSSAAPSARPWLWSLAGPTSRHRPGAAHAGRT